MTAGLRGGCPLCATPGPGELLAAMPPLPRSGRLLAAGEPCEPPRPLTFRFCGRCGFIWQEQRQESAPDYAHVTRATKGQLPDYIDDLLLEARKLCAAAAPRMADIGCNDGAFLDRAAALGYAARLGVEPSQCLAEACAKSGHTTECTLFCHDTALELVDRHEQADVLFVRHVLEHVPDPVDFLHGLRVMLAPGGVLLMEVPDTANILTGMLGHELWDEHLGYYTGRTLRMMLERGGFEVLRLETRAHRSGRNLVCWARAAEQPLALAAAEDPAAELAQCRAFGPRWEAFSRRLREEALDWPGPVAALGASHPQLNFLWYTGLQDRVDLLVDDDDVKIGHYLQLGRPTPIAPTARLLAGPPPGTFLCTAFGCGGWTAKVAAAMREKGVRVVDPYALLAAEPGI